MYDILTQNILFVSNQGDPQSVYACEQTSKTEHSHRTHGETTGKGKIVQSLLS